MGGIALMTFKGPVYVTEEKTIIPHVKGTALDDWLPTIDEIKQHECAVAMLALSTAIE